MQMESDSDATYFSPSVGEKAIETIRLNKNLQPTLKDQAETVKSKTETKKKRNPTASNKTHRAQYSCTGEKLDKETEEYLTGIKCCIQEWLTGLVPLDQSKAEEMLNYATKVHSSTDNKDIKHSIESLIYNLKCIIEECLNPGSTSSEDENAESVNPKINGEQKKLDISCEILENSFENSQDLFSEQSAKVTRKPEYTDAQLWKMPLKPNDQHSISPSLFSNDSNENTQEIINKQPRVIDSSTNVIHPDNEIEFEEKLSTEAHSGNITNTNNTNPIGKKISNYPDILPAGSIHENIFTDEVKIGTDLAKRITSKPMIISNIKVKEGSKLPNKSITSDSKKHRKNCALESKKSPENVGIKLTSSGKSAATFSSEINFVRNAGMAGWLPMEEAEDSTNYEMVMNIWLHN